MIGKIHALIVTLLGIVFMFIVGGLAYICYGRMLELSLDPIHAKIFEAENKRLMQTPAARPGHRLLLFGDSRIAKWKPVLDINKYEIINRGIRGDTTALALLRLDRDVLALEPDVVVIQIGINDLKAIGVFGNRKQEIVDLVQNNLSAILRRLHEHGIKILLMTVLPTDTPGLLRRPVWSQDIALAVAQVNRFIRKLGGRNTTIIDCDPVFTDGYRIRREYAADTVHLSAQGYVELTTLLQRSLDSTQHSEPTRLR